MSRGRESWGRGVDGEVAADSGRIQTQSAEEKMLDERLLLEDLEHQYLVGKVGKGADPGSTRSRRERKIQVLFTAAMTISGAMMMVGMTYPPATHPSTAACCRTHLQAPVALRPQVRD